MPAPFFAPLFFGKVHILRGKFGCSIVEGTPDAFSNGSFGGWPLFG